MTRRTTRRLATRAAVVVLCLGAAAAMGARAGAVPQSRAVVVVDFGDGVAHVSALTFTGPISGIDALQRAGYAPVVRAFGGNGGAVCALTDASGTQYGCPADSTCLTCDAPDYWSYFRALPGASHYSYSPVGAGSTTVGDGDVEAWKWGTGAAPRFVAFSTVFPPPPTTTTTVPATVPVTVRPATTAPPSVDVGGVTLPTPTPTTATASTSTATTTVPTERGTISPTTTPPTTFVIGTTASGGSGHGQAAGHAPKVVTGGHGGRAGPFVVFLVLVGVLLAAIVGVRVARRRPPTPS